MQRGITKLLSPHPSDEILARFIDEELDTENRAKVIEHLIECDECSDAVALVKKYKPIGVATEKKRPTKEKSKNKQKTLNNIEYRSNLVTFNLLQNRVSGLILSGLAAVCIIFIILPSKEDKSITKFKAAKAINVENISIEKSIIEIKTSMNSNYLRGLESFKKAKDYLKKKDFNNARESYCMALIEIEESTLDKIEKAKQSIFVNYQILLLSIKEGDEESASEYKDIIKDDIRRLKIREKNKNL